MTADVYADDLGQQRGARQTQSGAAAFDVIADAHADLVVRVGAALNLLNVAPRLFHMESGPEGSAAVSALVDCAEPQAELIARKLAGPEQSTLPGDEFDFHRSEYERLRGVLQSAYDSSSLSENATAKPALHDLLLRLRGFGRGK